MFECVDFCFQSFRLKKKRKKKAIISRVVRTSKHTLHCSWRVKSHDHQQCFPRVKAPRTCQEETNRLLKRHSVDNFISKGSNSKTRIDEIRQFLTQNDHVARITKTKLEYSIYIFQSRPDEGHQLADHWCEESHLLMILESERKDHRESLPSSRRAPTPR